MVCVLAGTHRITHACGILSQVWVMNRYCLAGSTSTRNSSRRDGSEAEVQQKTRKEMIIEKIKEQLIKAKVFIIKR